VDKAASVVPIIFGVGAAISAATGITSTGLQIAQHIQLQEQLKDQKELAYLQKELGRRQLAQYKKAEEAEQIEANMFSRPMNPIGPISTLQMTTRSMARQQATPALQRFGGNVNMANLNDIELTPRGSFDNISLGSPRNSISLGGSSRNLAGPFPLQQINRRTQLMTGTGSSSGSSQSLYRRNAAVDAAAEAELTRRLDALHTNQNMSRSVPNIAGNQQVRLRRAAFNAATGQVTLEQGSLPRGEYMRLANRGGMRYPNIREAFGRALRKHKRKLLIGGAVVGGAALLGGSIYGTIKDYRELEEKRLKFENHFANQANKKEVETKQITKDIKKDIKSEPDMQYDKPIGVFEKMANAAASGEHSGGGGGGGASSGGGYGNYQKAFQMAAKAFGKSNRRRRRSKKAGGAKTRKTRNGKVTKRRRSRKHINKHINKRVKKSRRHVRRRAF